MNTLEKQINTVLRELRPVIKDLQAIVGNISGVTCLHPNNDIYRQLRQKV